MKKLLYLFSATLLVFTSCSKDDSSTDQNTILSKGDSPTNQNLILPQKMIVDGESVFFTYNGNKIVQFNKEHEKAVYTYTGDLITKVIYELVNEASTETTDYSYENNRLKTRIVTRVEEGIITSKEKYGYKYNTDHTVDVYLIEGTTDETWSLLEKNTFLNGNIIIHDVKSLFVSTFEYDNKNSPFRNILGFDKLFLDEITISKNNVIKETRSFINDFNEVIFYEYDYNTNGYPTEQRRLFNGVFDLKTQYFY